MSTNSSISYSEGAKLPSNAPSWAVAASERLKKRREEDNYKSICKPPSGVSKVLLHSCCAPCSGAMVEEMISSPELEKVVVFFYNPNIHPRKEYEIRKEVSVCISIHSCLLSKLLNCRTRSSAYYNLYNKSFIIYCNCFPPHIRSLL